MKQSYEVKIAVLITDTKLFCQCGSYRAILTNPSKTGVKGAKRRVKETISEECIWRSITITLIKFK